MIKVEGHESLLRDPASGAIVNSSGSDYHSYMSQKRAADAKVAQLDANTQDINTIKSQLTQIQSLLEQLLGKQ